jgi:hypothetical protein
LGDLYPPTGGLSSTPPSCHCRNPAAVAFLHLAALSIAILFIPFADQSSSRPHSMEIEALCYGLPPAAELEKVEEAAAGCWS